MKRALSLALVAALVAGAAHAQTTACDVKLNVIDPDPNGLNVRALPSLNGVVITALKARGSWVRVHVKRDSNDGWMAIDDAVRIDESTGEEQPVFTGAGWVAVSKLGIETLNGGAMIYASPANDAPLLKRFLEGDELRMPRAVVLDCNDNWLKVRVGNLVGWTRDVCTNRLTTCV